MHLIRRLAALASLALSLAVLAPSAHAQLVQNGGFETGNFSNWTVSGFVPATGVSSNATFVETGTRGARLMGLGLLQQSLATEVGAFYELTFSLRNIGVALNGFGAWWGSQLLDFDLFVGSNGWQQYTLSNLVATDPLTTLSFGFATSFNAFALDNVSLTYQTPAFTPVPEPSTYGMMGAAALAGLVFWRRRARWTAV